MSTLSEPFESTNANPTPEARSNRWNLDALDPVQRTLAIPLVGRAHAARMFPELGFVDTAATRIVEQIRFAGTTALAQDRKFVWGTIVRTQAFDEIATLFGARFDNATALVIGVGLCTRALRVTNVRWIEVDVPEVMKARNHLLPAAESTIRIAVDLTREGALDDVLDQAMEGDAPILVIAEGFLMFLDPERHRQAFATLDRRLPLHSEVAFDYLHPIVCRVSRWHSSLRTTGARYRSGFRPKSDRGSLARLRPNGMERFSARLSGRLAALHQSLTLVARSPLYEIGCLRIEGLQ